MNNQFDDLLYLGWKNGQITNNSFSFMVRMQVAELRFWNKIFGSDQAKPSTKDRPGAYTPVIPVKWLNNRIKRLKEHGII